MTGPAPVGCAGLRVFGSAGRRRRRRGPMMGVHHGTPTTVSYNHPPARSRRRSAPRASPKPPPPASPQLPMADIAQDTEPDFWDGVDLASFGVERAQAIAAWPREDRMLAVLSLDVSKTAKVVASAIAFHGWKGWPGLDRLAELTRTAKPHVSRATKELERAGILVKTRRYHKAGHVGMQYSFSGRAIAEALDFRAGKKGTPTRVPFAFRA